MYIVGEYCNFPQIVHLFAALCIIIYGLCGGEIQILQNQLQEI